MDGSGEYVLRFADFLYPRRIAQVDEGFATSQSSWFLDIYLKRFGHNTIPFVVMDWGREGERIVEQLYNKGFFNHFFCIRGCTFYPRHRVKTIMGERLLLLEFSAASVYIQLDKARRIIDSDFTQDTTHPSSLSRVSNINPILRPRPKLNSLDEIHLYLSS